MKQGIEMVKRMMVLGSSQPAMRQKPEHRVTQSSKKKLPVWFWVALIFLFLAVTGEAKAGNFNAIDGIGEMYANCVANENIDQADMDGDGIVDACDPQVCGNGLVEGTEECDDNNLVNGDGCSSWCQAGCISAVSRNKITQRTFRTVQAATDDPYAFDHDIIQIKSAGIKENVQLNRHFRLTLSGGYNCDFSDNPSTSSINSLIIKKGTVVVENLIIKSSVLVAVIDSGFDTTNSELSPIITVARNFIGYTGTSGIEGASNTEGHGTAVASLIALVTDNVGITDDCCNINLMLLKAFRYVEDIVDWPNDSIWTDVIEAINYAVNNGAKVINLSFGSLYSDLSPGIRTNIQNAINYAYNNDVVVVTGAGNWGDTSIIVPANAGSSVLTVGGLASNFDTRWEWSNYGTGVDLWAPSENVYSFWNTNYTTSNGTSNASAIVTACVAMVRSLNPMLTAEEVMILVVNNTDTVTAADLGGRVNFFKAARAAVALRNQIVD